jgi:anti-anti-sigma regulatory factor
LGYSDIQSVLDTNQRTPECLALVGHAIGAGCKGKEQRIMILTQRQIQHGVFSLLTVGGLLLLINSFAIALNTVSTVAILIGTLLSGGLWIAYWRGWEYARLAAVILITLLTALGIQDVSRDYDIIIFIAPVMALILTRPRWMVASAITILGILIWRANAAGVYANTSNLIEFAVIIAGLMFSRLATDNTQRLAEAQAQAEQALIQAEQQAQQLAQQTRELAQRNADQQRLLDLVAELETPASQLAEGVLFVPIVGHLDSRRAQALTTRLLEDAHAQRAQLVILDIAGVSLVDTGVAQALLHTAHALGLLGCTVFLSGIAAEVATTLVQLGIGLEGITPVRNPQDALTRFSKIRQHAVRGVHFSVDADAGAMV